MPAICEPDDFGQTLRAARERAGLSLQELANHAGVTMRTIGNIERGSHRPTRDTVRRLLGVAMLGLGEQTTQPERSGYTPSYAPMRQVEELVTFFRGRGGTVDQSWLYIEPQAALDWLRYCDDASYVTNYRDRVPLDQIANAVAQSVRPWSVDVVALGSGDGRTETRLVSHLLTETGKTVNLDLLDCSHHLLMTAFRNATEALARHGVKVHPIHGDFYGLLGYELLTFRAESDNRRRLWTMLGHTTGNLRDEVQFFRDLASISCTGDLIAIDFQIVRAPADDEAAVRAADKLLDGKIPELLRAWLSGPLRRNVGATDIWIYPNLIQRCPVPGSYAVGINATVKVNGRSQDYHLARFKRYDPAQLAASLASVGWSTVAEYRYGPDPQLCGVLVAEKRDAG